MVRYSPQDSFEPTERALREWFDEGPTYAPAGMVQDFVGALETTDRHGGATTVGRFVRVVMFGAAAAAVVAVTIGVATVSQVLRIGPPPGAGGDTCPQLVRVENLVLPARSAGARGGTEVLQEPYVVVMGARLTNGNQAAAVTLILDREWPAEPRLDSVSGPVKREWTIDLRKEPPEPRDIPVTLGTPGQYRLSFQGQDSGCRIDVDVRAVLDTILRTYDEQRGLSEPPPADMR